MQLDVSAIIDGTACHVRSVRSRFLFGEQINDRPHKHYSMEFHCIFRGTEWIDLPDENRTIALKEGQILLIPQGIYHAVNAQAEGVDRICFYFDTEKGGGKKESFPSPSRFSSPTLFEDDHARRLMELCREEQLSAPSQSVLRQGLLMISTALRLLTPQTPQSEENKAASGEMDRKWVIRDYMDRHFTDHDGLEGLAAQLYLTPRQTSTLVKKYLGTDFKTAVRSRRMELAEIFLRNESLSLEEIAWQVGYRSYSGFQLSFKEHFGVSPSRWRKKILNPRK